MNLYTEFKQINETELPEKEKLIALYDKDIEKYEGEVKGNEIMLRREELSEHNDFVKRRNKEIWQSSLRRARYNLTRAKNLRNKLI